MSRAGATNAISGRYAGKHRVNSTVSDQALLERVAAGDQAAIRVLFARHHLRIYRFIVRMTNNEATAEELANEVFMEVWRNAGRFEGRSGVSTWMLSIARNKTISMLRKRSESQLDEDYATAIADDADTPDVATAKRDKGDRMRECLDQLSDQHREIIDLVYYHDKSISEVAEIVGIPEGTVKTRTFHARKKLGELLQAAGIDRGWP